MPEAAQPIFTEASAAVWQLLYFVCALYLLVPILWIMAVPEARESVARLTRQIMVALAIGLVIVAFLPIVLLGWSNPYIGVFYRTVALPALILVCISVLMTVITYLWARNGQRRFEEDMRRR